jgi:ATP-binding cassette subfamily B protein
MKSRKTKLSSLKNDLRRALLLVVNSSPRLTTYTIITTICQALLPVVSLYFIRLLVEQVLKGNKVAFTEIVPTIIGFSIVQLLIVLASQISAYITAMFQQKLTDKMSAMVLNKAINVNLEYYENPAYYDTLHLAQQQSLYRATVLLGIFNALLLNFLSLFFMASLFISMSWLYAVLFICLSLPLAFVKWYYAHKMYAAERDFAPLERESNYLYQVLTGQGYSKEVRTFKYGASFIAKFGAIRNTIYQKKHGLHVKLMRYSLLVETCEIVIVAMIFGMLAKSAWMGAISAGVFVIYLSGFQRLQSTAKSLLQSLVQLFEQRLFLGDLFGFLDIPVQSIPSGGQPFPKTNDGLTVNKLSFTYPGTENPVLHEVSLQCKPGAIVAIVGENGSGKSTLVKVLSRLYQPTSGAVTMGAVPLGEISTDSFAANTTFMFQDFGQYLMTVEENIRLGSVSEGQGSDPAQAARLSGAESFINKLAGGYQTRLGRTFKHSEQLSGGQWQKLALARVFYSGAQLVVLDEPTSALDALSEHEVFTNLKSFSEGRMIVLISHRLYNIKLADQIYVMHEGAIVECGDFNTLISLNGRFRKMYDKQKLE